MKICSPYLVILTAILIVCAGCGSAFFDHEIDVTFVPESAGIPGTALQAGIINYYDQRKDIAKIQMHSADSNGVVRLVHQAMAAIFIWKKRPASHSFGLYIPGVSADGFFHFSFEGCGKDHVRADYLEFDTRRKSHRPLSTIRSEVTQSPRGYQVKLTLPLRTLRDALARKPILYPIRANKRQSAGVGGEWR